MRTGNSHGVVIDNKTKRSSAGVLAWTRTEVGNGKFTFGFQAEVGAGMVGGGEFSLQL